MPIVDNPGYPASEVIRASPFAQHSPRLLPLGPATILDASRTDPFATFDIGDSRRARLLWDHGTCTFLLDDMLLTP